MSLALLQWRLKPFPVNYLFLRLDTSFKYIRMDILHNDGVWISLSAFFILQLICYCHAKAVQDLFKGEAQEKFYWGDWSSWSECERHCSSRKGNRRRVRVCFRSANAQHLVQPAAVCDGRLNGEHSKEESCYHEKCDGTGNFIGTWSPWEPWTCTYDGGVCGEGTNVRVRFCSKVADSVALDSRMRVGPDNCPTGSDSEEEECFKRCPLISRADKYGGWSDWTAWKCNTECEPGVMATRDRRCDNPRPLKGYTCPGKKNDQAPCNGTCLKQWGEWLHWSQCTETCDQALRERRRDCVGHGMPCAGESVQRKRCLDQTRHQLCPPVDGRWSRWNFWSDDCSVTCGRGLKVRKRECNNPAQAGVGKACEGRSNETRACTIDVVCPIDGQWSAWVSVGHCSKDCGGGTGYRNRTCTPPRNGGRPCEGDREQYNAPCNTDPCPDATLPPEIANSLKKLLDESHVNLMKKPGEGVRMDCTSGIAVIHDQYPDARIEWRRNGQLLAIDGARIQLDTGRLVVEAVMSADNGVYTCQAEAGGVSDVILAIFSLAVPPEAADIQAYEAEGLEVPCNGAQLGLVFDGFTTQWYKGERLIKSYDDVEPEEVNVEHFKNIDKRYEGVYKCVVTHSASQRMWVTNIAQVQVLPKRAMHKRLMAMALSMTMPKGSKNTVLVVAGGISGFVGIVLIGCCVCICCLGDESDDDGDKRKDKDKEASVPLLGGKDKKKDKPGSVGLKSGAAGTTRPKAGSAGPKGGSAGAARPKSRSVSPKGGPAGAAGPKSRSVSPKGGPAGAARPKSGSVGQKGGPAGAKGPKSSPAGQKGRPAGATGPKSGSVRPKGAPAGAVGPKTKSGSAGQKGGPSRATGQKSGSVGPKGGPAGAAGPKSGAVAPKGGPSRPTTPKSKNAKQGSPVRRPSPQTGAKKKSPAVGGAVTKKEKKQPSVQVRPSTAKAKSQKGKKLNTKV